MVSLAILASGVGHGMITSWFALIAYVVKCGIIYAFSRTCFSNDYDKEMFIFFSFIIF